MKGYCKDCPFWELMEHPNVPNGYGQCKLWPPVPVLGNGLIMYDRPVAAPDDWCGQHPLRKGRKGRVRTLNEG